MPRSLRKPLLLLLVVAVIGVLLYRSRDAIRLEEFDWAQLGTSIRGANPWLLLASVAGIYAAYVLRALRWTRFSRYLDRASFAAILRATLIGFSAVFLLGRAGEPIRPLLIARKDRIPVASAFGIYFLERVFDVASTLIILGLSLYLFPNLLERGSGSESVMMTAVRSAGAGLLVAMPLLIIFLVYMRLHGGELLARRLEAWRVAGQLHGGRGRLAMVLQGFTDGLQAIRTAGDLGAAVVYSVVHWVVILLIYLAISRSFGGRLGELGTGEALLVLAFTMMGSTVQLPGVGGGSQVASFVAFTAILGVEKEPAAAASILIWLITFAACLVAGIPLLIQEGWSMGELRRMARAEAAAEESGRHVAAANGEAGTGSGESGRNR